MPYYQCQIFWCVCPEFTWNSLSAWPFCVHSLQRTCCLFRIPASWGYQKNGGLLFLSDPWLLFLFLNEVFFTGGSILCDCECGEVYFLKNRLLPIPFYTRFCETGESGKQNESDKAKGPYYPICHVWSAGQSVRNFEGLCGNGLIHCRSEKN